MASDMTDRSKWQERELARCTKGGIGQWILARSVYCALRTIRFLSNRLHNLGELTSGFSLSSLSREGIAHLNRAVYGGSEKSEQGTLFAWEEEWFENDLPHPPARLLVGGAGAGREVKVLLGMGYEVVAFEPADPCVKKAKQEITDEGCLDFLVGAYEDLAGQGANDPEMRRVVASHAPYDGVLLGWGSFTHLRGEEIRLALLEALAQLCPDGPVLLSFWLQGGPEGDRRRKAFALGYRIGRFFNRHSGGEDLAPGDEVTAHAGYGHFFTLEEINALVQRSPYRLVENPNVSYLKSYPHITIKPPAR